MGIWILSVIVSVRNSRVSTRRELAVDQRCQPTKIEIRDTANFDSFLPQKWSKNRKNASNISNFFAKFGQNESENTYFKHFPAYPGDLVIRTGDREIRSVSGRLPDNPGELAYMVDGDLNFVRNTVYFRKWNKEVEASVTDLHFHENNELHCLRLGLLVSAYLTMVQDESSRI